MCIAKNGYGCTPEIKVFRFSNSKYYYDDDPGWTNYAKPRPYLINEFYESFPEARGFIGYGGQDDPTYKLVRRQCEKDSTC